MNEQPKTPAPLCFVDTETTGVHVEKLPWEIAIIRREPDGREREWHAFLPVDLRAANRFGLRVGKFYERHPVGHRLASASIVPPATMVDGLTPLDEAAETIARLTHGAWLVGSVPSFDAEVLEQLLYDHGLISAWDHHLIDIGSLALGYLRARGQSVRPPYRTDELTAACGVGPLHEDVRHTALGDARWARAVWDTVVGDPRLDLARTIFGW